MVDETTTQAWIDRARQAGWATGLAMLLDSLAPLGIVAAQILWLVQPASRWVDGDGFIGWLAQTLETPDAIAALRQNLLSGDESSNAPDQGSR